MGRTQPRGDGRGDLDDLIRCDHPAAEPLPQRLPFQKLRDGVPVIVIFGEVEDRNDVRMGQRGDGFRLALETETGFGILGDGIGDDFDRDVAVEAAVVRPVHLSHPALAEKLADIVRTEGGAGSERHGLGDCTAAFGVRRLAAALVL